MNRFLKAVFPTAPSPIRHILNFREREEVIERSSSIFLDRMAVIRDLLRGNVGTPNLMTSTFHEDMSNRFIFIFP